MTDGGAGGVAGVPAGVGDGGAGASFGDGASLGAGDDELAAGAAVGVGDALSSGVNASSAAGATLGASCAALLEVTRLELAGVGALDGSSGEVAGVSAAPPQAVRIARQSACVVRVMLAQNGCLSAPLSGKAVPR